MISCSYRDVRKQCALQKLQRQRSLAITTVRVPPSRDKGRRSTAWHSSDREEGLREYGGGVLVESYDASPGHHPHPIIGTKPHCPCTEPVPDAPLTLQALTIEFLFVQNLALPPKP